MQVDMEEGNGNMAGMGCLRKSEKKELKVLAGDFGLLHRKEVQDIIENCKSYSEGQQKIMRVYTTVYLK